jgi:signal transduction histidine kinase
MKVIKIAQYAWSLSQKDPEHAIQVFGEAIRLAKSLEWVSPSLIWLYKGKADTEGREEKYSEAIADYLEALKTAEDLHLNLVYYDLHFELSGTYRMMKDYELAGLHAQKCLDIGTADKNQGQVLYAISILTETYCETKQLDSASVFIERGMKLAVKLNDEYMRDRLLGLKADILWDRNKDYTGALVLYRQNLAYQSKIDSKPGIAWMHCVISRAFTDFNNRDSAYYHAGLAFDISKKYNLAKELRDAYEALYLSHAKFGDYKNAYEYRLIYDSLYNGSFNLASGKNAEKARFGMEQQRKDAEAAAENIKKQAAANRFKYLLAGIAFIGLITAGFQYRNSRQKQKATAKIEKAYSELKATQQQLIQSEKMASLGELTAGIAHEIQNPLNFVNNFSDLNKELLVEMKDEMEKGNITDAKEIADDIIANEEKINHHGKRADAIVKGMLQHSRSSSGQKESTNINALADEYLRLAYHGLRAKDKSFNATLKTDYDESIGNINIIPQDMGRVLLNLITNAFYVVDEKKKSGIESNDPVISVSTKKINNKVEIKVSDNGNGIPKAIIDKIFQPFFTTKPTGQGTGLGLSLAYDIIKAHGGELKVATTEGQGTEFIIYLPL